MNQLALNLDQPRSDGDCRTADDGFTLAALWAGHDDAPG
jgi:hypothetical protein